VSNETNLITTSMGFRPDGIVNLMETFSLWHTRGMNTPAPSNRYKNYRFYMETCTVNLGNSALEAVNGLLGALPDQKEVPMDPLTSLVTALAAGAAAALQSTVEQVVKDSYAALRSCCKIPHTHRFNNSRIMLIWIIAALLAVNLS